MKFIDKIIIYNVASIFPKNLNYKRNIYKLLGFKNSYIYLPDLNKIPNATSQ